MASGFQIINPEAELLDLADIMLEAIKDSPHRRQRLLRRFKKWRVNNREKHLAEYYRKTKGKHGKDLSPAS